MPNLSYRQIRASALLGTLIIAVFAMACTFAATRGGPAWMSGSEFDVFVRLALITIAVIVIDLCWKVVPAH